MPSRRRALRWLGVAGTPLGATSRLVASTGTDPVAWRRTFGDGDYQFDALVESGGGVLAVGRTGASRGASPWLAEVGPGGEPRWETTVDVAGFASAVDAVPVEGGYTVLGTTDESPHLWLAGLDGDGREQWRRRAEVPRDENGHGSRRGALELVGTDGGYLIGGFRGNVQRVDADLDAWVRAVGPRGERRWEEFYDATAVGDVTPWGDGYLLAGTADDDAWLQRVDADGRPKWRHTYGGVESEDAGRAVRAGDGVCYGGGTRSPPDGHGRGMLVRTTGNGEFVWRRTYDAQSVVGLAPVGDGFAFTGEPPNHDRGGRDPDKPVVRVDRWGRVRERVTVQVPTGAPGGLVVLEDGVVVGGWSSVDGYWLTKVDLGG